jgi:hypothetical protein
MTDEMYGDGGVAYGEQVFQERRERRAKTIKDQEDFAKKLLIADTAVKGINFLINQRADTLDANNAPAKAAYTNYTKNLEIKREELKGYENAPNKETYIKDYIINQTQEDIQKEFPALNRFQLQQYITKNAEDRAKLLVPEFDKMYKELSEVPSYEEFVKNYDVIAKQNNPRSIFGAATKSIKNVFKSETPATIAAKNKKQKDIIYNSPLYDSIQEYKEAVKPIDDSLNLKELLTKIRIAKEDGLISGAIVEGSIKRDKQGDVQGTSWQEYNEAGLPVNFKFVADESQPEKEPINYGTPQAKAEVEAGISLLKSISKNTDKELFKELEKNPTLAAPYGRKIYELQTRKSISNSQAAKFVFAQLQNGLSIEDIEATPSLFDIDKVLLGGTENQNEIMASRTKIYVKDIFDSKGTASLIEFKDTLIENINKSSTTKDVQIEEKEALNEIIKEVSKGTVTVDTTFTEITADEENKIIKEEESFLQSVNNVPVVGDITKFFLGDELDLVDATWLIPGYALLKLGGKVAIRTATTKFMQSPKAKQWITQSFEKVKKGPLLGFKNQKSLDKYLESLPAWKVAVIKSINPKGTSLDTKKLITNITKISGSKIVGYSKKLKGKGLYSSGVAAGLGYLLGE